MLEKCLQKKPHTNNVIPGCSPENVDIDNKVAVFSPNCFSASLPTFHNLEIPFQY